MGVAQASARARRCLARGQPSLAWAAALEAAGGGTGLLQAWGLPAGYLAESTMLCASASKAGKLPVASLECTRAGAPPPTETFTSKEEERPAAPLTSALGIRAWIARCRSKYLG